MLGAGLTDGFLAVLDVGLLGRVLHIAFLAVLKNNSAGAVLQVAFFHWQFTGSTGAGSISPSFFFGTGNSLTALAGTIFTD